MSARTRDATVLPTALPMLDREELLSIVRLHSRHGVLSVYVDADAELQAAQRPGFQVTVANELRAIEERVEAEGPRERRLALATRLRDLHDELLLLLDPAQPGRGRALFAPIDDGRTRRLSLRLPVPTLVVLDESAHVGPLVAALDSGRATGLVTVSRSGVRVLDWRLGAAEDLVRVDFEEQTGEWRKMQGPAAANPAMMQQTAPQRDRYQRRLDDQRQRFLRSVAADLDALAADRGWLRLVAAGPSGVRASLLGALSFAADREVVEIDAQLEALSAHELARFLAPELTRSDGERRRALAQRARDDAHAGGAAAFGLGETLTALAEGRVAQLLVDLGREHIGSRAPDGTLLPAGELPPATAAAGLVREPRLAERMIVQALESGAEIVPVDGDAAELLAPAAGVAALLRW